MIATKISRALGLLKCTKRYTSLKTLNEGIELYKGVTGPYLNCYCSIWGSCGTFTLNKLQKLQNRAARIVTSSVYDSSAATLIQEVG